MDLSSFGFKTILSLLLAMDGANGSVLVCNVSNFKIQLSSKLNVVSDPEIIKDLPCSLFSAFTAYCDGSLAENKKNFELILSLIKESIIAVTNQSLSFLNYSAVVCVPDWLWNWNGVKIEVVDETFTLSTLNSRPLDRFYEFWFSELKFQNISVVPASTAATYGCAISNGNSLVLNFDSFAPSMQENSVGTAEISVVIDSAPIKLFQWLFVFSASAAKTLPDATEDSANENVEWKCFCKEKIFPRLLTDIFPLIEAEKRPQIYQNVILLGSGLCGASIKSIREFFVAEIEAYFCQSSLVASTNLPQDFSSGKVPDYYTSCFSEKEEMMLWLGAFVYAKVAFSEGRFYKTIEQFSTRDSKSHASFYVK